MAQTKEHSEAVFDISFAPTDLKYASASRDSTIKVPPTLPLSLARVQV